MADQKKTKQKSESVRVSLRLSAEVHERLKRVQEMSESPTLTEVIRRSLVFYDALNHEVQDGTKVILRAPDGTEREVMLIF